MNQTAGLACNGGSTACCGRRSSRRSSTSSASAPAPTSPKAAPAPAPASKTTRHAARRQRLHRHRQQRDRLRRRPPRAAQLGSTAPAPCGGGTPPPPPPPPAPPAPPTAAIYQIQGSGATSPYVGQVVTTSGVVTKVNNNGFFMQDLTGDGNPATSDGIFVFTSSAPTRERRPAGAGHRHGAGVQRRRGHQRRHRRPHRHRAGQRHQRHRHRQRLHDRAGRSCSSRSPRRTRWSVRGHAGDAQRPADRAAELLPRPLRRADAGRRRPPLDAHQRVPPRRAGAGAQRRQHPPHDPAGRRQHGAEPEPDALHRRGQHRARRRHGRRRSRA